MIEIKRESSLINAVKKYDLAIISHKQHGFMRSKITLLMARKNSGTNGGTYRNLRKVTMNFSDAAKLFAQGILINHPTPIERRNN